MTRARKRAAPAPAPASGFGALSAGDAHTFLQLLLPKLPVFERARAGAVNRAWRDAASAPEVWARINLKSCANEINARALVALCARSGAALQKLVVPACRLLSIEVVLYALRAGGCVGLRTLTLPQPAQVGGYRVGGPPLQLALVMEDAQALRAACPALEKVTATLMVFRDGGVAAAAQQLPGASFALLVPPYVIFGPEGGTRRSANLSHPSVASVHLWFGKGNDALTEAEGVALAELAVSDDTEQSNSAESAELKREPVSQLELVGDAVGDATAAAVAVALRAPRCALQGLHLWGSALTDSGVSAVADALAGNTTLRVLHLKSFDNEPVLGDLAVGALATAMRANSSLRLLSLTGDFSDAACAELFAGLAGHAELRILRLHNLGTNAMTGAAGGALSAALRVPGCLLESIWLQFRGGYEPDASAALGTGLAGNTSLRKLQMSSNVEDAQIAQPALGQALCSALLVNTTLRSLDLMHIDGRALEALAPALAVHPSLTEVDFSFSFLNDAGTVALARALAAPTCACVRLGVTWCIIAGRGGEALADVLRRNTRLEKLEAHGNVRFPLDTLGKALRANSTSRLNTLAVDQTHPLRVLTTALDFRGVTSLTLRDFSFKFAGDAAALATLLSQSRCTLRKLHVLMVRDELLQNVHRRQDLVTLASGLSRNTSLTSLNIEGVSIELDNATTLGRALRGHPRLALLQFANARWYRGAAEALLRALCADDGDVDDDICVALALLYIDFRAVSGDPLREEEKDECFKLMDSREPYALALLHQVITT